MKLHRPVAAQIVAALSQVFFPDAQGRTFFADKVLERLFKNNKQLGARDRRTIAEATYDIVRWWRLLWFIVDEEPSAKSLWRVVGAWILMNDQFEFPPWQELEGLNNKSLESRLALANKKAAIRESIPDWLDELGRAELGANWEKAMAALNHQAPVVLRANRLKTDRKGLLEKLRSEGLEAKEAPSTEDGVILNDRRNIFKNDSFQSGLFEVQDGASQQASPMLGAATGMRVIDGCAGAGGKTLHLAAMMKNKGKIIALDIHDRRLDELRKRCARAGVDIVEARVIEGAKTIKRLEKTADRVLLDVPCTGLGVLRRNPDSKWKLKPEDLSSLRETQKQILSSYSEMLKPGGRMVYSTCSILPSENENQVAEFLKDREGSWKLIEQRSFWPGENGYDGFFAAVLERI